MTSELLPVSERASLLLGSSLLPPLMVVLALLLPLLLVLLLNPAVVASHRQLPAVLMQNSPLLQAPAVAVPPAVAHSSMSVSQLAPLKPVPAQSHNCVVLF